MSETEGALDGRSLGSSEGLAEGNGLVGMFDIDGLDDGCEVLGI